MTTDQRSGEVVLRPAFSRYRRGLAPTLPFVLLTLGASAALWTGALVRGVTPGLFVAIVLLVAGVCGGYLVLNLRNVTIFAGDGYFGRTGFLGRRRAWPRADLVHVERRVVDLGQGARERLLFVGHRRRLLMNLPVALFAPDDVDALLSRLNVDVRKKPDIYSAVQMRREFPSAVPWWLAHPLTSALVLTILLIVVLLGLITMLDHPSPSH